MPYKSLIDARRRPDKGLMDASMGKVKGEGEDLLASLGKVKG